MVGAEWMRARTCFIRHRQSMALCTRFVRMPTSCMRTCMQARCHLHTAGVPGTPINARLRNLVLQYGGRALREELALSPVLEERADGDHLRVR